MVRKLHILICDDNELDLALNRTYVEVFSKQLEKDVSIHMYLGKEKELKKAIAGNIIDIAILDVDMPENNGISIAKALQKVNADIPIVFISSHEEYKGKAIDILATGFIAKPIVSEKFFQIYKRALMQAEENKNHLYSAYLKIKSDRKDIALQVMSILFIEKVQRKILIHTEKDIYETTGTLSDIEKKLLPCFQRISQSVIVNMNEVICIDRKKLKLSNGEEHVIGITYAKNVLNTLIC